MKFIPDLRVGPFDDGETLWAELRTRKHRLIDMETLDELFRYDGTRIAIVQASDGQIFLEIVVDEGDRPVGDGPVGIEHITHYLPFQDQATIHATMNHDFVPTEATYAAAGPVVRVVFSHIHEAGRNHTIGYSSETVDIGSIDEGEMPHAYLRPGRLSVFGPYEDPFSEEATKEIGASLLHGPEDEIIGYFDCARAWIARRPGHFNAITLVVCVADDPEGYVQHRLHFDDEKAMLDSLATFAPTMETYRIAKSMRREVIGSSTPRGTWVTVEDFKVEDLADDDMRIERPAFDTAAEHDAKWPDFAMKPDGERTGGDAPEGEGN